MKKLYIAIGVIGIAGVIYFTGLYTYFIRTEIQEVLPTPVASGMTQKTLALGTFGEIDFIHKGSGEAKIVDIGGKRILRLENFNVVSGPDLYVYISKSTQPTKDIKSLDDFVDLGQLKGTTGNQNYDIPSTASSDHKTAIIWCKRYGVLFTFAVMN